MAVKRLVKPKKPAKDHKSLNRSLPKKPDEQPKNQDKFGRLKPVLTAIFGVIVIIFILFSAGLYTFKWISPVVEGITAVIPYPVALVNSRPIYFHSWEKSVLALQQYYQLAKVNNPALVSPSLSENGSSVLGRLIDQELLNQEVIKYNVKVTADEIDNYVDSLARNFNDDQELESQLKNFYGWNLVDFKNEIVQPLLLRNQLAVALLDEPINQTAKARAENILAQVNEAKISFADLAKMYSEDASGQQGGDLGYISRGQLVPEIDDAIFSLAPGQISNLVKSPLGFHILKVTAQLTDNQGNITQVKVQQILVRGQAINDYLNDLKTKSKIVRLIKI